MLSRNWPKSFGADGSTGRSEGVRVLCRRSWRSRWHSTPVLSAMSELPIGQVSSRDTAIGRGTRACPAWSFGFHACATVATTQRIAAEQLVPVYNGASDWLDSCGAAERMDGGYRVTARK